MAGKYWFEGKCASIVSILEQLGLKPEEDKNGYFRQSIFDYISTPRKGLLHVSTEIAPILTKHLIVWLVASASIYILHLSGSISRENAILAIIGLPLAQIATFHITRKKKLR